VGVEDVVKAILGEGGVEGDVHEPLLVEQVAGVEAEERHRVRRGSPRLDDPTIEVLDDHETVLARGRFGTDKAGYVAMRKTVSRWPERVWAVEGSNGAGRPLAQRLLADGEQVVDVPAKLSARARLFDTGHNRETDAHDAHAVGVVAVRTRGLRVLAYDAELEVLRMLADRREELTRQRVQTVNRLHRLLSELIPGKSKKDITALQAKAILASIRPRDLAGKTRRRLAVELTGELEAIDKKTRALDKELTGLVTARGSTLMDLHGIGPSGAARLLADAGDIYRFASRDRFASWNGTAPLDASSGRQTRHRLSRAGNRRINRVLHIMAVVQLRNQTKGRAYFDERRAGGMPSMMAMRALKRRLSNIVFACMLADQKRREASPGGQSGTPADSSVAGPDPRTPALRTSHVPGPPLHSLNGVLT
jgi:transposase